MTEKMQIWNATKRPPSTALKPIKGGRLSGMTDISPQWRYQAMTEVFGPIGIGWYYDINSNWLETGADGAVAAFCIVHLFVKGNDGKWSEKITGMGGSMFVAKERNGLYTDDECYKKAETDALGTAMKKLGVGASIHLGEWDGAKYTTNNVVPATGKQWDELNGLSADLIELSKIADEGEFNDRAEKFLKISPGTLQNIDSEQAERLINTLKAMKRIE